MTLFFLFSTGAVLTALCSNVWGQGLSEPVKIDAPFSISPANYQKSYTVQQGYVYGARDCGGTARILQVTHNHCHHTNYALCTTGIDKAAKAEIFFVPSVDVKGVITRVSIITRDEKSKSFDFAMPDVSLIAGQPYVLRGAGNSEKELLGREFTAKFEILKESDKTRQACAEIDLLAFMDERQTKEPKKLTCKAE